LIRFIEKIPNGWIIVLIILSGVISLIPSWLQYDIISMDGAFQYAPVANLYLKGAFLEALTQKQLPLFPILLAGFSWISGLDIEMSGRLISVISFILAAIGIYKLTFLITSSKASGLTAVLFMITSRVLLYCSVDCLKESLIVCFIVWANYSILKGLHRENKKYALIAAGLFILGMGALLRSTTNLFIFAWMIVWVFHKKQNVAYRLLAITAPVIVVIAAWLIKPDLPIFVRSYDLNLFFGKNFSIMHFLNGAWSAVDSMFSAGNQGAFALVLAGFFLFKDSRIYRFHTALTLGLFFAVYAVWGFASDRYSLAPVIMTYPLAAAVIMKAVSSGKKAYAALAFAVLAFSPVQWVYNAFDSSDPEKLAQKDAGIWIEQQFGPENDIITNRERLAFYAKGNLILINTADDIKKSGITAVDITRENGPELKSSIENKGGRLIKEFYPVFIYK